MIEAQNQYLTVIGRQFRQCVNNRFSIIGCKISVIEKNCRLFRTIGGTFETVTCGFEMVAGEIPCYGIGP